MADQMTPPHRKKTVIVDGIIEVQKDLGTLTGQPTVLGWPGHESQWRGGREEQGSREDDVNMLYATTDWQTAKEIISRYNIRYVYVGNLEHGETLREEKFQRYLKVAFQQGNVTIYEVP